MSSIASSNVGIYAFKPYKRGYKLPGHLRSEIAAAHRTRLELTTLTAVVDLMSILAFLGLAVAVWWHLDVVISVVICLTCSIVCARQFRALECLVHEASHFNWSRRHRVLNDVLATLLAAIPTGTKISDYRASHLLHHGQFATVLDPDRQRYVTLGLETLRRSSPSVYWWSILRLLPRYQAGWFNSFRKDPRCLLLPIAWAAGCVSTPFAFFGGPSAALVATTVWLVSYYMVLPVIRLVGESAEHVYSTATTVFDATVSNLGLAHRLIFHPHADGYHTVHHLWPGIPHHALRKIHNRLTEQDQECYGKRVKTRRRVGADIHTGAWPAVC